MPNARLTSEAVVNRSYARPLYRCKVPVGIGYGADPRAVEAALLEAAGASAGALADPPPSVRFRSFGESALNFELLCWTDSMLHRPGRFLSDLNFEVHRALTRHGIEFPRPQVEVAFQGLAPAIEREADLS